METITQKRYQEPLSSTIILSLGEKITEVQAHSNYGFELDKILDDDVIVGTGNLSFEYLHHDHKFTLLSISQLSLPIYAGQVYAVRAIPHLRLLKLDEALKLYSDLSTNFEQSGWEKKGKCSSLHEVKTALTDFKAELNYTVPLQKWEADHDEINVMLRRHYPAGTDSRLGNQDLFLVIVLLDNLVVRNQACKHMLDQREIDGVNRHKPRILKLNS